MNILRTHLESDRERHLATRYEGDLGASTLRTFDQRRARRRYTAVLAVASLFLALVFWPGKQPEVVTSKSSRQVARSQPSVSIPLVPTLQFQAVRSIASRQGKPFPSFAQTKQSLRRSKTTGLILRAGWGSILLTNTDVVQRKIDQQLEQLKASSVSQKLRPPSSMPKSTGPAPKKRFELGLSRVASARPKLKSQTAASPLTSSSLTLRSFRNEDDHET